MTVIFLLIILISTFLYMLPSPVVTKQTIPMRWTQVYNTFLNSSVLFYVYQQAFFFVMLFLFMRLCYMFFCILFPVMFLSTCFYVIGSYQLHVLKNIQICRTELNHIWNVILGWIYQLTHKKSDLSSSCWHTFHWPEMQSLDFEIKSSMNMRESRDMNSDLTVNCICQLKVR